MAKSKTDDSDVDNDPMFAANEEEKRTRHNNRLTLYFDRVDRLEEEKKGIADDIKDVWAEMKAVGYDTKIGRVVHRLRKMNPEDRAEYDVMVDTYRNEAGI